MSDTPMTDAVIANDDGGLGYIANLARLARKLERENAQLKAELERARQDRNRIAKDVRNEMMAQFAGPSGGTGLPSGNEVKTSPSARIL